MIHYKTWIFMLYIYIYTHTRIYRLYLIKTYILFFKWSLTSPLLDPKFLFSFAVSVVDLNQANLMWDYLNHCSTLIIRPQCCLVQIYLKRSRCASVPYVGSLQEKCSFSSCRVQQDKKRAGHWANKQIRRSPITLFIK